MIAVDILTGAAFLVAVVLGALAGRFGIDPQWGLLFFVIGIALALVRAALSEGQSGHGDASGRSPPPADRLR